MQDRTGQVEVALDYHFRDPVLLRPALIYRSYAHEHDIAEHNQPLEFLVAEKIVRRCPELDDGAMPLVGVPGQHTRARRPGAAPRRGAASRVGRGTDQRARARRTRCSPTPSRLSSARCSSTRGEAARRFVWELVGEAIDSASDGRTGQRDAKTALQELAQARLEGCRFTRSSSSRARTTHAASWSRYDSSTASLGAARGPRRSGPSSAPRSVWVAEEVRRGSTKQAESREVGPRCDEEAGGLDCAGRCQVQSARFEIELARRGIGIRWS